MANIKEIIQQMIDDGQSDTNIQAVIDKYKSEKEGKTSDPANAEANAGSEKDTASSSENGFSESPFWNPNEETTVEKTGYFEENFGKGFFTNFLDDAGRVTEGGLAQGGGVDEAFDLYNNGPDMTQSQLEGLIKSGRRLEEAGQTDEMIYASKMMEKYKSEGDNGITAFFKSYFNIDNPTVMAQHFTRSMVGMASSLIDSEEVLGSSTALAGGGALAGAGVGLVGGPFAPITSSAGALSGTVGGFMMGLSGAMETGLTTAQLLQESALESGLNWASMSDDARMAYVKKVTNNEAMFNDIKSKALARGLTIGAIDGITGIATGGVSSVVRKSCLLYTSPSPRD